MKKIGLSMCLKTLIIICFLFSLKGTLFCDSSTYTSSTYSYNSYPVLFIGNINCDCIQDTVYGYYNGKSYLPRYILWGQQDSTHHCDSVYHYDSTKKIYTTIAYPSWVRLEGSYSIKNLIKIHCMILSYI
jgi:hypothetical protein